MVEVSLVNMPSNSCCKTLSTKLSIGLANGLVLPSNKTFPYITNQKLVHHIDTIVFPTCDLSSNLFYVVVTPQQPESMNWRETVLHSQPHKWTMRRRAGLASQRAMVRGGRIDFEFFVTGHC